MRKRIHHGVSWVTLNHQSAKPKHWYDRALKKELARSIVNSISIPICAAVNRVKKQYSGFRRHETRLVRFETSEDCRMFGLEIFLPATGKPVVYGGYVSTQEWYISPKEAERRANRFKNWFNRKFGVPPCADVYVAFICKKLTSGARRVLLRKGLPPQSPKFLRKKMIEYFSKRVNAIRQALSGKRIYGELAFLVWVLSLILAHLVGSSNITECTAMSSYVLAVAERAEPPPLGEDYVDNLMRKCIGDSYGYIIQRVIELLSQETPR